MTYRFAYQHFRFPSVRQGTSVLNTGYRRAEQYSGRHGTACRYKRGISKWLPSERGGYTFCYVYDDSDKGGELLTTGRADCSPLDAFCYRIGRRIARGRALKALGEKQHSD